MATSTTPGGVQSVSTGFKMMHVLYKRRKKHRESWWWRRKIFSASTNSDRTLRNAHHFPDYLRDTADKNKRSDGPEKAGSGGLTLTDREFNQ